MNRSLTACLMCVPFVFAGPVQAELVLGDSFFLDLGSTPAGGGPLQAGYQQLEGGDATPITQSFTSSLGVGGTLDVSMSGHSHTRDYLPITGGPFQSQSDLLSDHFLNVNAAGTMTLTLDDLKDGNYRITTYHHNTQFTGTFDLQLTDGEVTDEVLFTDQLTTTGQMPSDITSLEFDFVVAGGSPVMIEMVKAGGAHMSLNGFDLFQLVEPPLTPEPASIALFTIALGSMGGFYAWRKRQIA